MRLPRVYDQCCAQIPRPTRGRGFLAMEVLNGRQRLRPQDPLGGLEEFGLLKPDVIGEQLGESGQGLRARRQ